MRSKKHLPRPECYREFRETGPWARKVTGTFQKRTPGFYTLIFSKMSLSAVGISGDQCLRLKDFPKRAVGHIEANLRGKLCNFECNLSVKAASFIPCAAYPYEYLLLAILKRRGKSQELFRNWKRLTSY